MEEMERPTHSGHSQRQTYTIDELRGICLWPSGGVQEYPTEDMEEVWPGLFLGNARSAADADALRRLGVRSVLNAAHGQDESLNLLQVCSEEEYSRNGITYLGISALDMSSYPLQPHFRPCANFIAQGLRGGGGVLVHCRQGISRSAALIIAYMVLEERMDLKDALREARSRREILPNDGFLQQLAELGASSPPTRMSSSL